MRIRIKFTKNDPVRYLGHLDIMRAFQRFFNCAEVKMSYTEGFNPHQKMHFALPLGVGITSTGEYLDAEIADGQQPDMICKQLNAVSGAGFDILCVKQLREDAEKAMAAVKYSDSTIIFEEEMPLPVDEYLNRPEIIIPKKTKTGIRDVDVRQLDLMLLQSGDRLLIRMKTGSENSIKPELIAQDLLQFSGQAYHRDRIQILRNELYARDMIPLMDYQTL